MKGNTNPDMPKTTGVGYCRPPEHTRFKKGVSGNPRGRPKGSLNLATILERTLREKVVINENGQRETVTKMEAATKQIVNKAASGELRAIRLVVELLASYEERSVEAFEPDLALGESDEKIVLNILRRFDKSRQGGHKGEDVSK
jgi:hypothetical protein